jgi:primosomal protein N' (replication factor Y)
VLVQSFCPDHPAIANAARHDYEGFVRYELPTREAPLASPYGRIVRLIARGKDEARVEKYLDELAKTLRAQAPPGVRFWGPSPTPILKIREEFRFHLQARCASAAPLRAMLRDLPLHPPPNKVDLAVDVDPISML